MALNGVENAPVDPCLAADRLEAMAPGVVRLKALRDQPGGLKPLRDAPRHGLRRIRGALAVRVGLVEQRAWRCGFHEVKEAKLDKLRVQGHVAELVGLDRPGFGCEARVGDPIALAHVLLAKLANLADAGARVGRDDRRPSLCSRKVLALAGRRVARRLRFMGAREGDDRLGLGLVEAGIAGTLLSAEPHLHELRRARRQEIDLHGVG